MPEINTWTQVGSPSSFAEGQLYSFALDGQYIALVHLAEQWYAFDDTCTHAQCPLSDGYLEGTVIQCPCHGAKFDLATGAVVSGPATEPVQIYPVRLMAEQVEISLPYSNDIILR
jgi:nitrite reductase/ring-hydroxylating ferredoxin subunit